MAQRLQVVEARKAGLDADPARSRTLPGWAYTDPALYSREVEEIFFKTWHFAGAAEELKQPGDYITQRLLDQSVIVIRGKDGDLRGFYNVCQHRAHELLKGRGRARVITCPYHAWSYHADGGLRTARGAEKLRGFEAAGFSLKPVRVEVFAEHFVFFNLDPDATPLSEQAGDLAAELKSKIVGFDQLVPQGPEWTGPIAANWKVVVDNFLECYHCAPAHPAFADLVDMASYHTETHGLWSSQHGRLGRPDNKAYPVAPDAESLDARFWWLWPTASFNVLPGEPALNVFIMQPTGLGTTLQRSQRFGLPGRTPDPARLNYGNTVLGPEDVSLCESVQRGLASRGYDAGRFIHDPDGGETTEAAVHHFHRMVAEAVGI